MPTKAEVYTELANDAARGIVKDHESWAAFLSAAARFYKYPYTDQLMIYAQRPDATACAEYDIWNNAMHRYVRRGAKGIALLRPDHNGVQIRYLFDIADTGTRQDSRTPNPWALTERNTNVVSSMLEQRHAVRARLGIGRQVEEIARQMADAWWEEHGQEIVDSVDGSFLTEYPEFSIEVSFRNLAAESAAYVLKTRCGLEPKTTQDSFNGLYDWNTPNVIGQLGTAVSQISEQVLREIERTIREAERREEHDRTELQAERGLPDSRYGDRRNPGAAGQVRADAAEVPAGAQAGALQPNAPVRHPDVPPAGNRGNGEPAAGADDDGAYSEERSDRETEGGGSDGLGGSDEQPESAGGGNDPRGTDIRINRQPEQVTLFPTEQKQQETIDRLVTRSAERRNPSALLLSDAEIENVLRQGSGFEGGKLRIAALYATHPDSKTAQAFLKEEYGIGGRSHSYLNGAGGFIDYDGKGIRFSSRGFAEQMLLRWPAVEQHIRSMTEAGTFLSTEETEKYEEILRGFAGMEIPMPTPRTHYPPLAVAPLQPASREINTAELEHAFQEWNGSIDSKHAVARYLREAHPIEETAVFLRQEYGDDLPSFPVTVESAAADIPWTRSAVIIRNLLEEDRFYTEEEQDQFLDIDTDLVRERLAENGIVGGEIVNPKALENSTVVQLAAKDAASVSESIVKTEDVAEDIPPLLPNERRIPAHDGIPAMREITIDLTAPEPEQVQQDAPAVESTKPSFSYELHPDDEVFLEGRPFIVDEVRLFDISFRDTSAVYPIFRVESREMLERLLPRDERNDKYKTEAEHKDLITMQEEAAPEVIPENYRITDDHLGEGGQKTKFERNVRAIRTLKTLEKENRPASPEDQEVLSQYVGWGGLPQAFDERNASWSDEYRTLKNLLTESEYEMARASTLNAHYTTPTVIRAMYDAIGQIGFRMGNILEPSCGVGNFFGMIPESMQASHLYGVELDSITGRIAQYLYPHADISVTGFEKTDRRDFFDLAIGNVPFGSYKLSDRRFDKHNFLIHDYFFVKALDQVRPGGVIAFITSKGTMDKQSAEVRKYLAERAELLGAIRLPNSAFKANAGTEVTSDILFLQKREQPIVTEPDWVHLGMTEDGIPVNAYFAEHPEMVLGTMAWSDSMYGSEKETACLPIPGADLSQQLSEAVRHIAGEYHAAEMPDLGEDEAVRETIPATPDVRNYSYALMDGKVYYRENSVMVRPELNTTAEERIKGMIALRDCVHRLMDAQLADASDTAIQTLQAELSRLYDSFTAKHGLINSRANNLVFREDSSYYLLCSLEILDENGALARKADMFTKRTIRQQRTVEHVDTAAEALAVSIAEKAGVNMPFMANLTGKSQEEIARDLTGVIFRLPAPVDENGAPRYFTADEYLSGNVREKLREARKAADISPLFQPNVEALEKAQPKDLDASEIDVRLGATWVGKEVIQQFLRETFEIPFYQARVIQVQFSEYTAEWRITGKTAASYSNVPVHITYGTDRANGLRILEDTLNLRDIRIYDTIQDADGKERRVLNQKETTLAQQKQQMIKDAFREWIWKDPDRREALVKRYNELFNSIRPREYDGSHITFSGMNPEIRLREHQLNAIAHILYGGNTLLAHQVGAGKTFEIAAAAMESKRLGLCQKSMFVVPNHLTEQWAAEFLRLYPSARILVTTKKDFEKTNRKKFCARIATGDYDAIIIGHSQFERIPVSLERQERLVQEQIDEITNGIQELKATRGEQFSIKQLERTKKQLEGRLRKLQAQERKDDVVTFEQLGVDRLFVDEAHAFKNMFLMTKMRNVAGLSTSEAQKSTDMFLKCRYMDELTGGRGVIFATGTPVSNSMTELYTMQRYLQYGALKRNHMTHFDCWASTFGETVTAIELAPEGTGYRARTRFAKFFNLPELMSLFKEVADIKTADQLQLPTPTPHYETVVVQPTELQKLMVQELSERAAKVHSGNINPRVDNMLKITSDGRKLGLDQRLINPMLPDDPGSKVNACVNNVFRIWQEGSADKLTQLIFCDISTPKGSVDKAVDKSVENAPKAESPEEVIIPQEEDDFGEPTAEELSEEGGMFGVVVQNDFSVYEDIRDKLIARGVPPEEITFIHDANTEVRKKELFAKVRSGQVRVLLGSTAKMGAGTNVQDRLIACHDLDCPWRPGDLEQRAGRIVRQGNGNPDVHIYRYVTESTFDAYLWQTVENKQKFISQIMTSKSPVRACDDVDETALSYAEIKALCAGDPKIKEKMDLDVDVARLRLMRAEYQSNQYKLEDKLLKQFPQEVERNRGFLLGLHSDMETLETHPLPEKDFVGMTIGGQVFTERDAAGTAILEACKTVRNEAEMPIGEYRGLSMSVLYNPFVSSYYLMLRGEMSHQVELGTSATGNLTRIENVLSNIPHRIQNLEEKQDSLTQQIATAKAELAKPFPQEEELRCKSARLAELDAALNMDRGATRQEPEKEERPSVKESLKVVKKTYTRMPALEEPLR